MVLYRFRCHYDDPTVTHIVDIKADSIKEAWETFDTSRREGEVAVGWGATIAN